jgi:probable rRNA maturation factor
VVHDRGPLAKAMISIAITQEYQGIDLSLSKLKQLIRLICTQHGIADGMVSLAIIDDIHTIAINRKYLDREGTTDCFSFDLSDDPSARSNRVFEIVVNGEKARQESQRRGHSAEAELALYVTHGMLHNLGFDDITEDQSEKMHAREDEILQHFGYGVVYNSDEI